jgi:hypothetical protein
MVDQTEIHAERLVEKHRLGGLMPVMIDRLAKVIPARKSNCLSVAIEREEHG